MMFKQSEMLHALSLFFSKKRLKDTAFLCKYETKFLFHLG